MDSGYQEWLQLWPYAILTIVIASVLPLDIPQDHSGGHLWATLFGVVRGCKPFLGDGSSDLSLLLTRHYRGARPCVY